MSAGNSNRVENQLRTDGCARRSIPSSCATGIRLDAGRIQREFWDAAAPGAASAVFEGLDNVLFFVKDQAGIFIQVVQGKKFTSHSILPLDLVGLTDFDLFPSQVASRIRLDDLRVMESGMPLRGIMELLISPARSAVGWHLTHKYPVLGRSGNVMGVMGTVQRVEGSVHPLFKGTRVAKVMEQIRREPGRIYTAAELGRDAGVSERHLGRRFHEAVGMPPGKFILLCRLSLACEKLLNERLSIAQIATECGFYDQSAFTRQCRKATGMTPAEYRAWSLSVRH